MWSGDLDLARGTEDRRRLSRTISAPPEHLRRPRTKQKPLASSMTAVLMTPERPVDSPGCLPQLWSSGTFGQTGMGRSSGRSSWWLGARVDVFKAQGLGALPIGRCRRRVRSTHHIGDQQS